MVSHTEAGLRKEQEKRLEKKDSLKQLLLTTTQLKEGSLKRFSYWNF